MANVISSFSMKSNKPNFDRDLFNTISDMVAFSERRLPDVFIASVKETGKIYKYNKLNEVDPILGKWRLLSDKEPINAIAVNGIDSVSNTLYINKYLYDIKTDEIYYIDPTARRNVSSCVIVNKVTITQTLYDTLSDFQKEKPILWLVD